MHCDSSTLHTRRLQVERLLRQVSRFRGKNVKWKAKVRTSIRKHTLSLSLCHTHTHTHTKACTLSLVWQHQFSRTTIWKWFDGPLSFCVLRMMMHLKWDLRVVFIQEKEYQDALEEVRQLMESQQLSTTMKLRLAFVLFPIFVLLSWWLVFLGGTWNKLPSPTTLLLQWNPARAG